MTKHFIVIITSFGAYLNIVKSQISLFVAAIKQLNCLPNRTLLPKTLCKAFETTENSFAECISNSVSRIAQKKTYKKVNPNKAKQKKLIKKKLITITYNYCKPPK